MPSIQPRITVKIGFNPLILDSVAIIAVILGHVTYRAKATDATIRAITSNLFHSFRELEKSISFFKPL